MPRLGIYLAILAVTAPHKLGAPAACVGSSNAPRPDQGKQARDEVDPVVLPDTNANAMWLKLPARTSNLAHFMRALALP